MKTLSLLLLVLYLAPPIGLFTYAATAANLSWLQLTGVAVRLLACMVLAVAVGIGIAEKVPFLRQDGHAFYARLFLPYVAIFLTAVFVLGIELQSLESHQVGRYTY
ncbi:hypothetical protein [Xanthomonas campestris]|uniref:hypothetical protein n=1 Tax=Xanthomonas campestris TaxID=339 RepID=UPI0011C043DC|nr:hypothetical protein [Xanthomonas campestris]